MKMYNKNQLNNSRIFFDKNPPMFMKYFLVGTVIFLIAAIFLSMIIPKTYIVQAQGTIEADDKTYISPMLNGTVLSIEKKEGDLVQKGDVVVILTSGAEGVEVIEIDKQIDIQRERINLMSLYKKSLDDEFNYLLNEGSEQEFYGKVEYYLEQVNNELIQKNQENEKITKKKAEKTLIEEEIKELKKKGEETKEKEEQVKSLQEEINELESAKESANSQSSATYNQLTSEVGASITQSEAKISELDAQKMVKQGEEKKLNLVAQKSGKLHYLSLIKPGIAIQGFQPIAQVDQGEGSKLIVESYIDAQEISKIKIGNIVNVSLQGVNETKFGTILGRIEKISDGTIIQQVGESSQVFYQVIITIDSDALSSKKGESIEVLPSMQVNARIVYNSESYFEWIIEELNLVNK